MPPVFRDDPYANYNFRIEINGVTDDSQTVSAGFSEVSGLDVEIDVIEYRNGNETNTVRKIPGLKKFTNITLKRGVTGDLSFWNWVLSGVNGQVNRTDGSVILLDENRQEVMRWNFKRGWVCKFAGPDLNSMSREIAVETIEICHEGLEIDT